MSTKSSNCTKLEATARPGRQRRKVRAGAASGIWGILGHSREVVASSLPPPHNRSPLQLLLGPARVLWCFFSLSTILQFQYISPLQPWLGPGLSSPPTIPPPSNALWCSQLQLEMHIALSFNALDITLTTLF